MSIDKWSLFLDAVALLVIIATALAGLIQLRHLRHQNTLNAELAVLHGWNEPQFREWRLVYRRRVADQAQRSSSSRRVRRAGVDRARHPELYACDWMEQIGSYLKYRLVRHRRPARCTSTSINRLWNQLAPAIERMRVTRGERLYENFEVLGSRRAA